MNVVSRNSGTSFCVSRTHQEVIDWLSDLIIPRLESEITAATFTSGDSPNLPSLNTQLYTSAYQLATLLAKIPEQNEKYHKYLRIAADGDGNKWETKDAQFSFAKGMEDVDPALSFIYYKNASANNHSAAAFRLGELWESGSVIVGGEASLDEAVKYYQIAEKAGNTEAGKRVLDCVKKGKGGVKRDLMAIYKLESRNVFDEVKKRLKGENVGDEEIEDEDDEEEEEEEDGE
ncbi:hypothetical protein BDR26DRAFT_901015 [Obelidium mucronatum]|nr:hypothetical protein BDR26DRAFT_901015 [Obelidium mucronatum]